MNITTQRQIILAARKLIHFEKNWTQNTSARDENDCSVGVNEQDAIKFCARGAIARAIFDHRQFYDPVDDVEIIKTYFRPFIGLYSVTHFNDNHSHVHVLRLFQKASRKARLLHHAERSK